jgi:hypothetical protein
MVAAQAENQRARERCRNNRSGRLPGAPFAIKFAKIRDIQFITAAFTINGASALSPAALPSRRKEA